MKVFADAIFKRLANAAWLEVDYDDIQKIAAILEKEENMYYRSLAVKMRNASTVVLTSSKDDDA